MVLPRGTKVQVVVFGVCPSVDLASFLASCEDFGLGVLALGRPFWESEHIRCCFSYDDSCVLLARLSRDSLHHIRAALGWRVVCSVHKDQFVRKSEALPQQEVLERGINLFEFLASSSVEDEQDGQGFLGSSDEEEVRQQPVKHSGHQMRKSEGNNKEKRRRKGGRKKEENVGPEKEDVSGWKGRGLRIGSRNISGFTGIKRMEMGELASRLGLDVVAIQETWEKAGWEPEEPKGFKWFGKPSTVTNSKRGEKGVGFLVRDFLVNSVTVLSNSFEDSMWICLERGQGASPLILGCVYMPDERKSVLEKEAAWEALKDDVRRFFGKGEKVIVGDFNAWVGRAETDVDVVGPWGEERMNDNGRRLRELLKEFDMVALNNRVEQEGVQYTREKGGSQSCTDYILAERTRLGGVSRMRVDKTEMSTDHHLIWVELQGNRGRDRGSVKKEILKWRVELLRNAEVRDQFVKELKDELASFPLVWRGRVEKAHGVEEVEKSVEAMFQDLSDRIEKVAERVIGKKRIICGRSVKWWCPELREIISKRRNQYKEWLRTGSKEDWEEYKSLRREGKLMIELKKRGCWEESMEKMEAEFKKNPKLFWSLVNRVTRKSEGMEVKGLKDGEGKVTANQQDILKIFQHHYEALGRGSVEVGSMDDADFRRLVEKEMKEKLKEDPLSDASDGGLDEFFGLKEIGESIAQLPNGKAAPGVVNELLKEGGNPVLKSLTFLFNEVWKVQKTPASWGLGIIVNLFKKGAREDPGNYRGITLLLAVRKLFCRVLNNRLMGHLDGEGKLHESQAGFRPGRSCEDHIFTLSQIVQGRRRGNQKTFAFFLDVKKAYDSVWRPGLWKKLWDMGVRGRMLRTIISLYSHTKSRVMVNGELSEAVVIEKGVAQGCTLSCTLFDVFVNDLLVELDGTDFGVAVGESKIHSLMFADDFVGLESSAERLQEMIEVVERWCDRWGLEANVSKCAIVVFNGEAEDKSFRWQWGVKDVPVRPSYTYLGVEFEETCKWEKNVNSIVEKGAKALAAYQKLLRAKGLAVQVKRQLLISCIRPTLEYGGGVWEPSKEAYTKLERVQLRAAKTILQCAKSTASVAVRGDLGLETLEDRRDIAKVMWWHKVGQMGEGRFPKLTLHVSWPKVRKGADVKSWGTKLKALMKEMEIGDEALKWKPAKTKAWVKEKLEDRRAKQVAMEDGRKLEAYHAMKDKLELQPYLKGGLALGAKLKFKFRAGSHGLAEETGRRQGQDREHRVCQVCKQEEVESVAHFLWSCPVYAVSRNAFMDSLQSACDEQTLSSFFSKDLQEQTTLILSHSHWEKAGNAVDQILKEYLTSAWATRCNALYKEKSFFLNSSSPLLTMGAASLKREANGQKTMAYHD